MQNDTSNKFKVFKFVEEHKEEGLKLLFYYSLLKSRVTIGGHQFTSVQEKYLTNRCMEIASELAKLGKDAKEEDIENALYKLKSMLKNAID